MSIFEELDWHEVRKHYNLRLTTHERMLGLLDAGRRLEFFALALGTEERAANYSAAEHRLGPKIASNADAEERVFQLAAQLRVLKNGADVPKIVHDAGITYLGVGVGSELACMVNPGVCWIANTRTLWTHLVVKHGENTSVADEALRLYKDNDLSSEMAYRRWSAVYSDVEPSMLKIGEIGAARAAASGVEPGAVRYIWADAIANSLYELFG